jgi:putative MFS transporter
MKSPYLSKLVLVAALGYFVDIYDLVLFGMERVSSLNELLSQQYQDPMVLKAQVQKIGISLLNWQMFGMLLGGIFWGILGDKKGRLSVLFGSILLYSLANLANAMVQNTSQYALLRFISGFGLAGELGAGITLVSETLQSNKRGYGATLVASVGLFGAVIAGTVGIAIGEYPTSLVELWDFSY